MAARWNIFCAFMTLWYFCNGSTFPVPLLMWSSKSLDVDDQILAGHTLSYEDVQDRYLDKLISQSNTVVVFVQDKLSIDDFAAYQNSHLKQLKKVLESSATSIVLPSAKLHSDSQQGVTNNLVNYFEKNSRGKFLSLTAEDDFPSKIRTLKSDESNIIIVHLPKSQDVNDLTERNLVASDKVIGKFTDELTKFDSDYIGLLTAEMPREDIMSGMEEVRDASASHVRLRRAAETVDANARIPCDQYGVLVVNADVMLYLQNISLVDQNNYTDAFKPNTTVQIFNADVENDTNSKTLSFSLSGMFINDSAINISMTFNHTGLRWWCVNFKINGEMGHSSINSVYDCSSMNIPIDKSYVCQANQHFNGTSNVTFQGLQVQPFGMQNRTFSNSYDCVGFFTPPIWMGLISVGVLVTILYGGILSLLSIKSMDRFDNPKDPTIVIHNE